MIQLIKFVFYSFSWTFIFNLCDYMQSFLTELVVTMHPDIITITAHLPLRAGGLLLLLLLLSFLLPLSFFFSLFIIVILYYVDLAQLKSLPILRSALPLPPCYLSGNGVTRFPIPHHTYRSRAPLNPVRVSQSSHLSSPGLFPSMALPRSPS